MHHLIALTKGLRRPHQKVRLSTGAKLDLLMWLEFLDVSPFRHLNWSLNESLELFTDTAVTIGYGGYFDGKWFQARWCRDILALAPSNAFFELLPLVVAVHCWAPNLACRKVVSRSDNTAVYISSTNSRRIVT